MTTQIVQQARRRASAGINPRLLMVVARVRERGPTVVYTPVQQLIRRTGVLS